MHLTALFLATVAASAVAIPTQPSLGTPETKIQEKRQEPTWETGNCGMNIYQVTGGLTLAHSATITLMDAGGNEFHKQVADDFGNDFYIGSEIFDEAIHFIRHGKDDGGDKLEDGHTQGFDIEWHDDKFSTNDKNRCRVGGELAEDSFSRHFDCNFAC